MTASVTLGIIGLFILPFIFGVVAIILGVIGMGQAKEARLSYTDGKTGVILGIVDIVLAIIIIAVRGQITISWF